MAPAPAARHATAKAAPRRAAQPPSNATAVVLSRRLSRGEGVIFSGEPVGAVPLWAAEPNAPLAPDKRRVLAHLADGARVTVVAQDVGMGTREAVVQIRTQGLSGLVANARVVVEENLQRSSDGPWAVFSAIHGCVDFCHAETWLFGRQRRLELDDDSGPAVAVAWRSDGKGLALGSRRLIVVSLPELKLWRDPAHTSPAYGRDGELFARGNGKCDDALYLAAADRSWRKLAAWPGCEVEPQPEADEPDPPAPEVEQTTGEIRVKFLRDKGGGELRVDRVGKVLARKRR